MTRPISRHVHPERGRTAGIALATDQSDRPAIELRTKPIDGDPAPCGEEIRDYWRAWKRLKRPMAMPAVEPAEPKGGE